MGVLSCGNPSFLGREKINELGRKGPYKKFAEFPVEITEKIETLPVITFDKPLVDAPNLSLVLPGGCNANCSFCIYKQNEQQDTHPNYIEALCYVLDHLPEQFYQISITGGEPTISEYISQVMIELGRRRDRWTKIVLNTNGAGLINKAPNLSKYNIINHVNISRHCVEDNDNEMIFHSSDMPSQEELTTYIKWFNTKGVDVTLNTVDNDLPSDFIRDYIVFAKEVGASAVCFRKMCEEDSDLSPTSTEHYFDNYNIISESQCPVCRTTTQLIDGMTVIWKAGLMETETDTIYELIFHPNGQLTADWGHKTRAYNNHANRLKQHFEQEFVNPEKDERIRELSKEVEFLQKRLATVQKEKSLSDRMLEKQKKLEKPVTCGVFQPSHHGCGRVAARGC
jgi:MoaA/NifB/PqqE/SkfB family radical SAM enzyme